MIITKHKSIIMNISIPLYIENTHTNMPCLRNTKKIDMKYD